MTHAHPHPRPSRAVTAAPSSSSLGGVANLRQQRDSLLRRIDQRQGKPGVQKLRARLEQVTFDLLAAEVR